jgi:CcmD family protein
MDDNLGYLVAAYTIIWVAIAGYVFRLARIQSRIRREIDALRRRVSEEARDTEGDTGDEAQARQ